MGEAGTGQCGWLGSQMHFRPTSCGAQPLHMRPHLQLHRAGDDAGQAKAGKIEVERCVGLGVRVKEHNLHTADRAGWVGR